MSRWPRPTTDGIQMQRRSVRRNEDSYLAAVPYNTDFAQVEADEQQVNLTRFNLFFPEKREFFLEGRGIPWDQRQPAQQRAAPEC